MTWNMVALLAAPRAGANGTIIFLVQIALMILIFYFIIIRPQRKLRQQHEEMLKALKKGDEVLTEGGIIGEVVGLKEDRVTLKTAESTRIVVARAKITRVFTKEAPAPAEKAEK